MIKKELWHSWDAHPWKHPWLNKNNLIKMRDFSRDVLAIERENTKFVNVDTMNFVFVCNMANSLYQRMVPLRKSGLKINMLLHPQDQSILCHPAWEEFNGTIDGEILNATELFIRGEVENTVSNIFQIPQLNSIKDIKKNERDFLTYKDILISGNYLCFFETIKAIREANASLITQAPYLGYLSKTNYVSTQSGGDIWFEASRNDLLGVLQRKGFSNARLFLTSNPWSYAHARRFGLKNLIYLPLILDEEVYAPGIGKSRKKWQDMIGGDFFILSVSRFDQTYKGSLIGLEGFVKFAKKNNKARLILIRWGKDEKELTSLLREYDIEDKVLFLPLTGKELLRDYLRSADCMIDQFVLGYFGATGLEAMASGLPIIGRVEDEQYEAICETGSPPILNTDCSSKVEYFLNKLNSNKEFRKNISQLTRKWFVENHGSKRWLPDYKAVLVATAKGQDVNLSKSPLQEPLSKDEKDYHADGLLNAPDAMEYKI